MIRTKASAVIGPTPGWIRSEEHTSELQSRLHLVCRLLLEKKKNRRIVEDAAFKVWNDAKRPAPVPTGPVKQCTRRADSEDVTEADESSSSLFASPVLSLLL